MNTTHDIPTTPDTPDLVITDNKHLVDVIFEMAELQLILNRAEADMQSRVEVIKKAYDEATAEHAAQINTLLTSVEAYAIANKDKLFPIKGSKRAKTFKVLQHALKFRESSAVEAPDTAVTLIKTEIEKLSIKANNNQENDKVVSQLIELISTLDRLLRWPDAELNKDAVKSLRDEAALKILKGIGIEVTTSEAFKVEFNFTPES